MLAGNTLVGDTGLELLVDGMLREGCALTLLDVVGHTLSLTRGPHARMPSPGHPRV